MKYNKPVVLDLMDASKAIQGSTNKGPQDKQDGNFPFPNTATSSAYEADE